MPSLLQKLNPFNSLFGRIFLGFWGTVVFIVAMILFVNQQLSDWDKVRPVDKGQAKQLYKISEVLERQSQYDIRVVAKRLERKFRHTHIILKDASTGKLRYPRTLPHADNRGVISALALKPEPLQVRQEDMTLIGPKLINVGNDTYQLILMIGNQHSAHIWLQIWKMPLWLKVVLLGLVTLLPCWLIARGISKPITKLRHSSQTLAEGDLQHRVEGFSTRKDEIGYLANDFNNMAHKLSAMVELYKRLLADVSHELRTPLTRLELSLAMALKNPKDNLKQLQRAERELHKLDDIIGNVLRLAKLENKEVSIEQNDVDLSELLFQTARSCQLEANEKNITLTQDVEEDLRITGDEILLGFAVDNILRNAIKYSPEESSISLHAQTAERKILITVTDQGPGVDEHELEQLFVPFFRGQKAMEESNGAGLGLAIASKAIMRHGGSITAESNSPSGLKVIIELPVN